MKDFFISVFLSFVLLGCSAVGSVSSINEQVELLKEGDFEFYYPEDWKINAEERNIQSFQRSTIYKFRHPKNRDCYVLIEIMDLPQGKGEFTFQDVVAVEVRFFKPIFEHAGYRNFTFKTNPASLSDQAAVKLTMTGRKSGVTRTVVSTIVFYKNNYYIVSYQWFDRWGPAIANRLEKMIQSFRFFK